MPKWEWIVCGLGWICVSIEAQVLLCARSDNSEDIPRLRRKHCVKKKPSTMDLSQQAPVVPSPIETSPDIPLRRGSLSPPPRSSSVAFQDTIKGTHLYELPYGQRYFTPDGPHYAHHGLNHPIYAPTWDGQEWRDYVEKTTFDYPHDPYSSSSSKHHSVPIQPSQAYHESWWDEKPSSMAPSMRQMTTPAKQSNVQEPLQILPIALGQPIEETLSPELENLSIGFHGIPVTAHDQVEKSHGQVVENHGQVVEKHGITVMNRPHSKPNGPREYSNHPQPPRFLLPVQQALKKQESDIPPAQVPVQVAPQLQSRMSMPPHHVPEQETASKRLSSGFTMPSWVTKKSTFWNKHQQPTMNRVFGGDLEDMTLCPSPFSRNHLVPLVVKDTVSVIANNLNAEGIFRVSGSNAVVSQYKMQYEQAEKKKHATSVDITEMEVHVASSLLKSFVRDLKKPLFSHDVYMDISIAMQPAVDRLVFIQQRLLTKLSQRVRHVLYQVFAVLSRVYAHRDTNKMNTHNLAVVWCPNFIREQDPHVFARLCGSDGVVFKFIEFVIVSFDAINF